MVKLTTAIIIAAALILILPTDPITDGLITLPIISAIGFNNYCLVCVVLLIIGYLFIRGDTIKDKINTVKKEARKVI